MKTKFQTPGDVGEKGRKGEGQGSKWALGVATPRPAPLPRGMKCSGVSDSHASHCVSLLLAVFSPS